VDWQPAVEMAELQKALQACSKSEMSPTSNQMKRIGNQHEAPNIKPDEEDWQPA
jgi:hypothetical protein